MNEEIILYTTGCPRCISLKKKLDEKGVEYAENNSVEEMLSIGITDVPVLKVGDQMMKFSKAFEWALQQ